MPTTAPWASGPKSGSPAPACTTAFRSKRTRFTTSRCFRKRAARAHIRFTSNSDLPSQFLGRPANMVWLVVDGLASPTQLGIRRTALPPIVRPDFGVGAFRGSRSWRPPARHSRIGRFTWPEPRHDFHRLRITGGRRAHHRAGGARKLRRRSGGEPRAGCGLGGAAGAGRVTGGRGWGGDQLRDVAALARPVPAGRVSQRLPGGAGPAGSRRYSAARLAERLRAAAPSAAGGCAAERAGGARR